ncbi:M-like protein [Deinococcus multiflagellatus]|uniref:M-like protein n=1 Tax=Deinococcus multiflagellatus TaxID=1656887 RepID=A0ABW1ZHU6_9DEIO|nr:M-like protein [Deinococcus multiflagellatus]MBZ9714563.1 M-like protein [Deinococcus multiflagellatus]
MTKHEDHTPTPSAQPQAEGTVRHENEISNVDLQFMGRPSAEAEIEAAVDQENKSPGQYRREGLDKQDIASHQSMDASDPPSTNMGDATSGRED